MTTLAQAAVRPVPIVLPVAGRVLIVDDHAVYREQMRKLLDLCGYEVVGEAEDGATALREAQRLEPDAVLLDVQLPDRSGFSVASALAAGPRPRVVLISSRPAVDYGKELGAMDAAAFIHKPDLSRALLLEVLGPPA